MANMTLQNLERDCFTCERCGGILKYFVDSDSEQGGIGHDIPCPVQMNAIDTYGIAKECNYAREQEQEQEV